MHVDVAFTPAEAAAAPTAIVVDVLRATSTIVQALASGYERVFSCAEIEDALALRASVGEGVLGGERGGVRIAGFDLGNSPREFVRPRAETAILTTTNGTGAIIVAAGRCERVLIGSLLNLDAVAAAARELGEDVAILCAGVEGAFAIDDAYCAGRIVERLGGDARDAAHAASRIARSFANAEEGLGAGRSAANLRAVGLDDDVAWCARESVCDVVPRFVGMRGAGAEVGLEGEGLTAR